MAATTATSAPPNDALAAAHARLLADHSFQFSFAIPPPPPKPPAWFMEIGRWIGRLAPYLQWVFWGVLAIGVIAIVVLLGREFLVYRRPAKASKKAVLLDQDIWRPSAPRARALLADADRLAAEGRYDEAARVLLYRSIDDIEEKRPRLVATAHTSRDIAVLGELPQTARAALEVIVRHVERSLFAGRALDASAFADCRRAYEAFAFPDQWARAA